MKILLLILVVSGGAITYLSKYIARFVWKNEEKEEHKIYVKLAGFALVVVAALIAFFA